eukprot:CAMPEP_0185017326 /NCGR_PEP_ID=MMETSP1103-20130426/289_1 /TAXON_ID=36769 /ORGANISM="Paraphysomonas bandaiensis, Strain Caron Lab Isolate" /LENGTH=122 /DNA_ID=CAMNT_0027546675 /DNA_START=66 /DNA_END=434 /DNA_ORIENTATION=+
MSADEVASAFIQHYYSTLDSNPGALSGLYQPQSTLSFEGNKFVGPQSICEKLVSLGKLEHNSSAFSVDVQLGADSNALLIFVVGRLTINGENPLHFTQMFQLVATGPGQYYVHNEIFRLVYG